MIYLLPGENRPFTGFHMLGVVALFFGTIITVNVLMAYWAVSTFPGLNAHNSYVASQNYNLLLKDAAAQDARGWKSELSVADARLTLHLTDRSGSPLPGLDVRALAGRPASASTDRLVELVPAGDIYRAEEPLASGRWLVEIEARDKGAVVWRQTESVSVR